MPTITIGRTNKKINSTKQTFTDTATVSVKLKQPCSMQMPVFELVNSNLRGGFYNYCSWGSWYYWIDDIVYLTHDILEFHCRLDPLATYKSAIQSSSGYVIYGDESNWNEQIDDVRMQPEIGPSLATWSAGCSMFKNKDGNGNESGIECSNAGCVCMTFTQTANVDWMHTSQATTDCGLHTALMSWAEFKKCMGDLNDFDITTGLTTAGALEIIQVFQNLIQSTAGGSLLDNIQQVIWLPLDLHSIVTYANPTAKTGLMLGGVLSANTYWYEIPTTVILKFTNYINLDFSSRVLPASPHNYKYLLNDRFSSIQVVTPGGYSDIGSNCLRYGEEKLYVTSALCLASGEWSMKLSKQSARNDCLASFSGCLGVNLKGSIAMIPNSSMQIAKAGAGIVAGAVGMGLGSIIGGIASGQSMQTFAGYSKEGLQHYASHLSVSEGPQLMSGIQESIPHTDFRNDFPSGNFGGGSTGMFLSTVAGNMSIYMACFPPKDNSNYKNYCLMNGFPVNKFMSLSGISGFVRCSGFSVQGATGSSESSKATINSYVNSGIYIE